MRDLPPALLLDMDDTILDDTSQVEACWDETCRELAGATGVEEAALSAALAAEKDAFWSDAERHRAGRLALDAARTAIVAAALRRVGGTVDGVAATAARTYGHRRREACRPFPGALAALAAFRARGVRLALLTNGESALQREKIERFALAPYFDAILIEGELGYGKPDERVFRLALAALGAPPRDAWVVGDNLDWEIVPAKRLGMGAVWVDAAGRGLDERALASGVRPDRIVRAIAELL